MNITEAYKTMMKAEPDYLAEKFGLTYSAVTWRKHELKNKKYPSNKKMVAFLEAFGAKKITEEQWELPESTQNPKSEKEKKSKINAAAKQKEIIDTVIETGYPIPKNAKTKSLKEILASIK